MNTPVIFLIAKLLKEKGFDEPTKMIYNTEGELSNVHFSVLCYAPTIAEVVMWLYKKYNIIIESCWEGTSEIDSFNARIVILGKTILSKEYKDFKLNIDTSSPTEAYEAAIEYTLTKLI